MHKDFTRIATEGGASVADFLAWFPGVTREQVDAVLEHTRHH